MTRVLVVRLSAMGDLVQSLGPVRALHEARPDLELCFVTQRENAPLLRGLPLVAHIVEHDRRGGIRAWLRTRAAMRRLGCEVALDLQGNWKSAACAFLSGARERIGAAAPWRQEPMSRALLTRTVAVDGPRHPGLVGLAIVRELAPSARATAPQLCATEEEVAAAAESVRANGIDPSRPFAVALLGRSGDPRSLKHAAIAAAMAGPRPVLVVLGPQEHSIPTPDGAVVMRQPKGQLRMLVGLGEVLRRCGGEVLGGDQGPVHVLAAAGAPCTVWFGPQDPERTASPLVRVLRHPSPPACMPCSKMRCAHRQGPVCMDFVASEGREVPPPRWLERRPG